MKKKSSRSKARRSSAVRSGGRPLAGTERVEDFRRRGGRHVGVDRDQLRRRDRAHDLGQHGAPVAALRDEAGVAEPLHQRDPGGGDPRRVPARRRRPGGEAVAGDRGDHDVERVRRGPAISGGIGQRPDDLELLDDRARPAVGDDDRQRIFMPRADVDEVDVEPVDLGDEIRQARSAAPRICASRNPFAQ